MMLVVPQSNVDNIFFTLWLYTRHLRISNPRMFIDLASQLFVSCYVLNITVRENLIFDLYF